MAAAVLRGTMNQPLHPHLRLVRDEPDAPELELVIREAATGRVVVKIPLHPDGMRGLMESMPPAANHGGAANQTASTATPKMRINADAPRLSELIDAWDLSLAGADLSRKYHHACLRATREAADAQAWVFPSQITPESVEAYLAQVKARGGGPKHRNNLRDYIRQFCVFLVRRGVMSSNPADAVLKARIKRRRARYVPTVEEVVRLISCSTLDARKRDRWLVYLLAASAGLRMRTLRRIRLHHVHLEAMAQGLAWLELDGDTLKNGECARVWLTQECAERLLVHIAEIRLNEPERSHLFACVPKWDGFERDRVNARIEKHDADGEPTFSPHSLRHFAATRLRAAERFVGRERSSQMTHRTARMTSVYTDDGHEMLGQKIWAMEPLLPSGFTGNRGVKGGRTGVKKRKPDLTRRGEAAEDVPANQVLTDGPHDTHPRKKSPSRDPTGYLGSHFGPRSSRAGDPLHGCLRPESAEHVIPERGDRFKSCHPDLDGKSTPITGCDEMGAAWRQVALAQARVIRLLLGSDGHDDDKRSAGDGERHTA